MTENTSQTNQPSLHPLDLPEIHSLISSFLLGDLPTLSACVRVSKAWNASFLPPLWSHIDLSRVLPLPENLNPRRNERHPFAPVLQKHAHLIRHISALFMSLDAGSLGHLPTLLDDPTLYINLQTFRISQDYSMRLKNDISDITIHEHYWGDLASFLRRVPSLRELVIRSMNSHVIPVAVWQTIATSLPTLRTLVFNGAHMDGEDPLRFDYFLDACSKVESLDLDFFSFWDPPAHNPRWTSTDPLFPRLVSLNFFGRRAEELRLFERCLQTPGLRRLTWSTRFPTQFTPAEKTPEVTRLIVEARLQNLEYLNLWDGLPFKDEEIARILDSLGRPLKELRVSASEFGYLSWNALLRGHSQMEVDPTATESDSSRPDVVRLAHAATLRTLDLTLCPDVTDDMLAQIKRDFPRLEQLLLREEPDYDSSEELEE